MEDMERIGREVAAQVDKMMEERGYVREGDACGVGDKVMVGRVSRMVERIGEILFLHLHLHLHLHYLKKNEPVPYSPHPTTTSRFFVVDQAFVQLLVLTRDLAPTVGLMTSLSSLSLPVSLPTPTAPPRRRRRRAPLLQRRPSDLLRRGLLPTLPPPVACLTMILQKVCALLSPRLHVHELQPPLRGALMAADLPLGPTIKRAIWPSLLVLPFISLLAGDGMVRSIPYRALRHRGGGSYGWCRGKREGTTSLDPSAVAKSIWWLLASCVRTPAVPLKRSCRLRLHKRVLMKRVPGFLADI